VTCPMTVRPSASYVCAELYRWHEVINRDVTENKNELTILKAFQSADQTIPTLSTELPICPKLTSKLLNFKSLSKPINSSSISSISSLNFMVNN
ncbi:24145_t:CDS:1, partial [Gigaspora rosea]